MNRYVLLFGVAAAACIVAAAAGWWNSATTDEPYHTLGAYAAVEGKGLWVVEHPPLYKLAAGFPLHFLPLQPPAHPDAAAFSRLPSVIHAFLHENHVPPLTILRVARLGMLVFLVLLLWGVFRLGELVGGPEVGLAAAFALACQPLVLGHAFVVHTDVPAAVTWVWATVFLERFLAGQTKAWVGLGLWLGLALAAKHSGVLLPVFFAVRVLVARLQRGSLAWKPLFGAFALAWFCVFGVTAWTLRHITLAQERNLVMVMAEKLSSWSFGAGFFVELAEWCRGCCHWLLGFADRWWRTTHSQGINYFWGEFSRYGFFLYFPVALLAKLSLPFSGLWMASVAYWRSLPARARWLALYVMFYLLVSLGSSFNIGARHLMPAVAWLAVLAGWIVAKLRGRLRAVILAALVAAPVVSFPHYISHFSLLVGGPRGGEKILNDSNLDWGQDWLRLIQVAKRMNWQPLYVVSLLGPDIDRDETAASQMPIENLLFMGKLPNSGYVAVSSWTATVGPHYLRYSGLPEDARFLTQLLGVLQRCPLVGKVGD
ncbi:MAG: glycosyltransferase family 39 protein, partial [Thermoanaerobaculum sp.]